MTLDKKRQLICRMCGKDITGDHFKDNRAVACLMGIHMILEDISHIQDYFPELNVTFKVKSK